jgi:hypothetical protein
MCKHLGSFASCCNAALLPLSPGALEQGLHDVASVLLLVAGERAAFAILCRLTTGALRDATRPTLDPVLELLGLMEPVMQVRGGGGGRG